MQNKTIPNAVTLILSDARGVYIPRYYDDITARLYQSGIEVNEAVQKGANRQKFDALEIEFKGGSIPVHLIYGFKYRKPYSCKYHTGGKMGEQLRAICAELRGE